MRVPVRRPNPLHFGERVHPQPSADSLASVALAHTVHYYHVLKICSQAKSGARVGELVCGGVGWARGHGMYYPMFFPGASVRMRLSISILSMKIEIFFVCQISLFFRVYKKVAITQQQKRTTGGKKRNIQERREKKNKTIAKCRIILIIIIYKFNSRGAFFFYIYFFFLFLRTKKPRYLAPKTTVLRNNTVLVFQIYY